MQWQWIARAQRHNLILFFNGWGMDQHVVSHLKTDPDHDVLMAYDYRDLRSNRVTWPDLTAYRRVDVLAWSMGVWAYAKTQAQSGLPVRQAIALNGTPRPIDDVCGIPEAVYAATARHFTREGRQKFFKRMCGSPDVLQWFEPHQPHRSLEEQREELLAIQETALHSQPATAPFSAALIGRRDKIMPARHQLHYWQGMVRYKVIDSPHVAFQRWKSWKEIFDDVATDS